MYFYPKILSKNHPKQHPNPSQKIMPKPPQSQGMQAQIAQQMMVVFPPMLTLIFIFMPAGVVIYSVVNMILSVVPQAIILNRAATTENE